MAYNLDISHADLAGVIPVPVATEMWESMTAAEGVDGSAVLAKARRVNDMSSATVTKAVTDLLPVAYFRQRRGLVQTSEMQWRDVTITAEELDVLVAIDLNDIDDANIPIWDNVRPNLIKAAGKVIDGAVLYGTGIPTSWATALSSTGLIGVIGTASQNVSIAAFDDLYGALEDESGYLSKIEADGYIATGHIAHTSMKGKIRGCRDNTGQRIFPNGEVDGIVPTYPLNGAISSTYLMVGGQWSELIYSVRKDISFGVFNEGIVQDGSGNIVYNLMQQRMAALMLTFRLGFALPNPVNEMQATAASRCAFAYLTA